MHGFIKQIACSAMRKSPQTYGINLSCDNPRRAENSKLNLINSDWSSSLCIWNEANRFSKNQKPISSLIWNINRSLRPAQRKTILQQRKP